jgi:hypothetical protein
MSEFIYTEDDLYETPVPNTGDFASLKQVGQLAVGQAPEGKINFDNAVDVMWASLAPKLQDVDASILQGAAAAGDASMVEATLSQMQERGRMAAEVRSKSYTDTLNKTIDLSRQAAENIALTSKAVVINNTPQEIAVMEDVLGKKVAHQLMLQKELEEATTNGAGSWIKGILHEVSPIGPLQGWKIQDILVTDPEFSGITQQDVNMMTTRNELITMLQNTFASKPPEQKLEWLTQLYDKLDESIFTNKLYLSGFISAIVSGEEQEIEGLSDWADRLGVLLLPAQVVFGWSRVAARVQGAAMMDRAAVDIARAGGKEAIAAAEAAKAAATMERAKAGALAISEATGVQGVLDLAKLASVSAARVLPDAITMPATAVQTQIRQAINNTVDSLKEIVHAKGVSTINVADELTEFRRVYSTANNPFVNHADFRVADDGLSIVGKVYYKPKESSSFLTKEAAENALATVYGGKGKVVPDTTNTGFLVEEDVVKSLTLERDALLAQMAEGISKAPKRPRKAKTKAGEGAGSQTPPKPVVEAPSALRTAKPRYKTNELSFDDLIDKAAYQIASKSAKSKSDPEITEWLKAVTGWDDKAIAAHAAKVREAIKNLPETGEAVRVRKLNDVPAVAAKGEVVGGPSHINDTVAKSIFTDTKLLTKVGNISYTSKIPSTILLPFIQRLGTALGMDKHPIAILQFSDIINSKKYASIAELFKSMGSGGKLPAGLHIPTRFGSVIVMGTDMPRMTVGKASQMQAYLELFAHEYGHAFEYAFQFRYAETIKGLFRQFLASKGLRWDGKHISEQLPLEALFEYRSITDGDFNLAQTQLQDFVSKYFAGDKTLYAKHEQSLHDWLSSYHEFFAENFAKWAVTDEVPTTILGTQFAKLVEGFRTIASYINDALRRLGVSVDVNADRNVAKFLNDHIKSVKAGAVAARELIPTLASASKKLTPSMEDMAARVAQIEAQLEAIDAASKGMKHGWLIESDVSRMLTFDVAGKYTEADINSAVRWAFGDWTLTANSEAVNKRLVGVHTQSRYAKVLTEFVRKDVEKLSKQEMTDLNAALVRGDQEGVVYDEATLAGMSLSQNSRIAYYKVRALRDIMHQVRNDVLARVLTRKGFLDLNMHPSKVPADVVGKLFGKAVSPEAVSGKIVYNISEGKTLRVTDAFRDKHGDVLVYELPQPMKIDGKYYTNIVVKADDVNPVQIKDALPYRKGEYSRQYEDQYWVKIDTEFEVDGAFKSQRMTHRTAATNVDAKAYAEAFNSMVDLYRAGKLDAVAAARMQAFGWEPEAFVNAMRGGEFGANPKANIYYNRTDDDFIDGDTSIGGIIGGTRGERVQNVYGNNNVLNPLDSIASEIGNTAYVATTLEWREAQIAKWWNTYFEDLPAHMQRMRPDEALREIISKDMYAGGEHRLAIAHNTAKYIQSQLQITTKEEQFYLGIARRFSENLEKTDVPGIHTVGLFMRNSSNWPQFIRTVAFHTYMGAFNIKHLFMQSMNAFNAVVISPIHGFPAAKVSSMYGVALMSDNEAIWRQVAKANKITSFGVGMTEDEFVEAVRSIRRSGLVDGIGFNSMWGAEGGRYGLFNGFTRKLGKVSATPFNIGDGYSRLVSYDIARREWKAANPGKPWWADDAVEEILARQDDLTQNMTKANQANWQKGAMSIPFQFTQYQIKLALNLMQSIKGNERTFSRIEAVQLFLGHTAFLGLAGWGLLPEEWVDKATADLPESERLSLQQGMFSWGIHMLSGGEANVAVGAAFGSFNYYKQILDGLLDPELTVMEALGGAGGMAIFNWLGKAGSVLGILYDQNITVESTKDMLTELGTGFSSINNAHKVYIATKNFNTMKSKSGRNQYELTQLELWAESIGIASVDKYELDKMFTSRLEYEKSLKDVGKEIGKQLMYANTALNTGDKDAFNYRMSVIKGVLDAHREDMTAYRFLLRETFRSEMGTQLQRELITALQRDLPVPNMILSEAYGDR